MEMKVREIEERDVEHIINYWTNSSPEFMVGMGVDLQKLIPPKAVREMLKNQILAPISEKKSFALIWELEGKPIGHTNISDIRLGEEAKMHLHIWKPLERNKGIGTRFLELSLHFFFEKFNLEKLWCEPYAYNPAPNKTLPKVGFRFIKSYRTIPGSACFEQQVNQYLLTKSDLAKH